jgi:phosphatidylserine/phosphatidylglycerophosphate/cardiolipin synthase-like enzyme
MLLGGIQIFEYMAGLMHAKTMVVDGVWATVGQHQLRQPLFCP